MAQRESFLPNFCNIRSVFAVVLTGEMLVFVLVLAQPAPVDLWQALALLSLFVQWIALGSAAALCLARRWLVRLSDAAAGSAAYLLILVVTVAVAAGGHWLLREPAEGRLLFVGRCLAIAAIVAAVLLRYLYVQHQARQRLLSEAGARIDALQARIRPHFLFNSLNTIASMIPAAPNQAEAAVEDLADLFRASLARGERLVPLADELTLARGYLRMEALRLGERLAVEWALEALPEDALVPPLTLQPLLENAVYYGIEPRVEGGCIRIEGERDRRRLRLRICNPAPAADAGARRGSGMAQANVRERLELAYGREAALEVSTRDGRYRLELRFPYREKNNATADRR